MKHFAKSILFALPVVALFACDEIGENERYIKVETVKTERTVLLEDYTGQDCVNCPAAHDDLTKTHELYGDDVITVAIHGGTFELSTDDSDFDDEANPYVSTTGWVGLANDQGRYYAEKLKDKASRPLFVINRDGKEYAPIAGDWQEALRKQLERPTTFSISVDAKINSQTNNIEVATKLATSELSQQKVKLQLWVVENGIIARQKKLNEGTIKTYQHDHVFRAAVNGLEGEPVTIEPNADAEFEHHVALRYDNKERWNPANLTIVAFLFTDADGVIQAAKTKVK